MTLREMTELIQQHHPHMKEQEIRLLLNRASDDFCSKTEIVKSQVSLVTNDADELTVANRRYYPIPEDVIKISEVFMNGVRIPRIIGRPIIDDTTEES